MGYLKTFLTILAASMMIIGTMAPAMAVSSKAYSFEDNLEVALPNVAYELPYVPGEILVKFNHGMSEAKINALNSKNGATVTYTSPYAGFKILKIPKTKSVEEMVEIYSKNPNVEYATANYVMQAAMVPTDPLYHYQWNFNSTYGINVTDAWDITNGSGAIVAILDTGVAYSDSYDNDPDYDLANTNFVQGYDFINGDTDPADDNGHGTHVAGTIAQSTNNGRGVAGIAYGCSIMPVKVLNRRGSGTLDALIDGIEYAADNGAHVISMSLSFNPGVNPSGLESTINYAYGKGVTIIAAAGNDGKEIVCYPAAYGNCTAVGATSYDGDLAYYSNWGTAIDVVAPGGDMNEDLFYPGDGNKDGIIQSTFARNPNDFGYYLYQGTSMATPHVSGVAALLISEYPDKTNEEIRAAIESSAKDLGSNGWDSTYGHGLVDAKAALDYLSSSTTPNTPPIANAGGPYIGTEGIEVNFYGSGSDDNGDDFTYKWDVDGDGSVDYTIQNPTHTYTAGGTYIVSLVVNDGKVDSAPSETTATIENINDAPIADAGGPYTGTVGNPVNFYGSGSDEEGDVLTYEWDLNGDGLPDSIDQNPTFIYDIAETYTVTLIVNDGTVDSYPATATVGINEVSDPSSIDVTIVEMNSYVSKTAGPNKFVTANATIQVTEGTKSIVGATVEGHWDGATDDLDAVTTKTDGNATAYSNEVKYNGQILTFTFIVDSVITVDGTIYEITDSDTVTYL